MKWIKHRTQPVSRESWANDLQRIPSHLTHCTYFNIYRLTALPLWIAREQLWKQMHTLNSGVLNPETLLSYCLVEINSAGLSPWSGKTEDSGLHLKHSFEGVLFHRKMHFIQLGLLFNNFVNLKKIKNFVNQQRNTTLKASSSFRRNTECYRIYSMEPGSWRRRTKFSHTV